MASRSSLSGRRVFLSLSACILLSLAVLGCGAPASTALERAQVQDELKGQNLLEHVRILSSPSMEGRATGTRGIRQAAEYIARQFRRAGLEPAGDRGSYLQEFQVITRVEAGPRNRLEATLLRGGGRSSRCRFLLEEDFRPFGFSAEGEAEGEVVFVGYGITAPELGYDDYKGLDVRGKVVLALTREPREYDRKSPFRRPEAFRYTRVIYKVINAERRGAKGILLVEGPLSSQGEPEELFAIRGLAFGARQSIPALNVRRRVVEALLRPSGKTLEELQRSIDDGLAPRSFLLPGVRVSLRANLIQHRGAAFNVVGALAGRDPKLRGEFLVIGAHYDHLGFGGEGSLAPSRHGQLHPGADDNASGAAVVMGLARALAAAGGTRRTLYFVAFAGEEMGLLGSTRFAKHSPMAISRLAAMLNFDMVGRMRQKKLHVFGADTAREFRSLLPGAARGSGVELRFGGDGYGPSDHTPFYAQRRPVLFFFTGPHPDYHRPTDTADKVQAASLEKVARIAHRVIREVGDGEIPLHFQVAREGPPRRPRVGWRGGYGAYFGIIPDFSQEPSLKGVLITGVRPGSPAERAGLRGGDLIVSLGGAAIGNLYDLVYVLRSHRAGDEVEVRFRRGGEKLQAKTRLGRRR